MGFFTDFLGSVLSDAAWLWAALLTAIGDSAFYVERGIDNVFSLQNLQDIYSFVSGFAISLLILKALKKGFWTYILWRDGDPDAPLEQTVINIVLSIVLTLSFPQMYEWYAQVSLWFINKILLQSFGTAEISGGARWADVIATLVAKGLSFMLVSLICIIMFCILFMQFIKRSVELMILRLGFPLACLGLLDSDNGVFTSTVKVFIQVSLTTTVQLFLMHLSVIVFLSPQGDFKSLFYCIAFCSAAMSTPKMLQFIMLPQGGGGGMYKVTGAVHTVSTIKSLIPR